MNNPTTKKKRLKFAGFKPSAMQRIAQTMGYTGEMSGFDSYLNSNPDKQSKMEEYRQAATKLATGGYVQNFNTGGTPSGPPAPTVFDNDYSNPEVLAQYNANLAPGGVNYESASSQAADAASGASNLASLGMGTAASGATAVADAASGAITGTSSSVPFSMDGTYDPSAGMPDAGSYISQQDAAIEERFQNVDWNTNGGVNADLGADKTWAKKSVTDNVSNSEILKDPTNYKLVKEGKYWSVVYPDGTKIGTGHQNKSMAIGRGNILAVAFGAASPGADLYKQQQDMYRNYLSSSTSEGVTSDLSNIEEQYNQATTQYDTLNLELSRLQAQADARPDDPYFKELVEAKGQELSDMYLRLQELTPLYQKSLPTITDEMTNRAVNPELPEGAEVDPEGIATEDDQFIGSESGQLEGNVKTKAATVRAQTAKGIKAKDAASFEAEESGALVDTALGGLDATQVGFDDPRATITGETQGTTAVSDLNAAQGTASIIDSPVQRDIQAGEIVTGSAVDVEKAAQFTEMIQAAQASPSEKTSVAFQLEQLMNDFDDGETPAWAAGSMRAATEKLAQRGLGASSMAGQAIIQATMESALPIAMADAQTQSQFESMNLSNRQQRIMLAAEQRAKFMGQEFDQEFQTRVINASKISDIANMNFTAEQQVQLENSRAVNTMNLANVSNSQAMILSEASALANLETQSLSNVQQAAVLNAQNFLNVSMADADRNQQVDMFKTQQQVSSIFNDTAAKNTAKQFNASSEQQNNQFYDNMSNTTNMFNAEQKNAIAKFNAGELNTIRKFNAELKNQREQFNAKNQLVVDQSNATWRREIATADTAATNRANEINAINTLDISNTAYNNMWQMYGDQMEWAWTSAESQQERLSEYAQAGLSLEETKLKIDAQSSSNFGKLVSTLLFTPTNVLSNTFAGSLFQT
tara:strand:+ start:7516 stop:10296 length:2781 start_codon:yes stop_codon:yes gene_type:complete